MDNSWNGFDELIKKHKYEQYGVTNDEDLAKAEEKEKNNSLAHLILYTTGKSEITDKDGNVYKFVSGTNLPSQNTFSFISSPSDWTELKAKFNISDEELVKAAKQNYAEVMRVPLHSLKAEFVTEI